MRDVSRSSRSVVWVAMDAAASGGFARRNARSVRRSRVVLAPRPWRYVGGKSRRQRGQERPLPRGEHEVSRKAIARGKPGCLGGTCSVCPCASHMGCPCAPAHGIYGRSRRPAFPAPSHHERDNELQKLGRIVSRECLRLSFRGERSESPESITTIVSTDSGLAPSGAPRNDEGAV